MPANLRRFLRRKPRAAIDTEVDATATRGALVTVAGARAAWDQAVVLSVARTIESDGDRVMHWFTSEPIRELGDRTAKELVEEGGTARLLDMLVSIRAGRREG